MSFDLSLAKLEAAWEHVQFNAGCAGVDSVTVEDFERQAPTALPELLSQAEGGEYLALPLRKLVAAKPGDPTKKRTLLVPAVRDRVLQTAVAGILSRSFEEEFLDASFGYRPSRGVDRAIARITQLRDRGWTWIVDGDINSYFDSVSHSLLIRELAADAAAQSFLGLLKQWIDAWVWDGYHLDRLRRGIPQGAPVSPVLANFFLTPVDEALEANRNHLIRYADDFLLLCQSESGARQAWQDVTRVLAQQGLQMSEQKSRITSFDQGFTFLGVTFRGSDVFIPWKERHTQGKLIFIARPMPQRALREYRKEVKPPAAPQPSRAPATPRLEPAGGGVGEMPFLYIVEQGAVLRKSGDRFLVEADQSIRLDVPYHRLENILIFGNVQVTTQALAEALDKGIGFSFFTRHGRLRGCLTPPGGRNVALRVDQYSLYLDEPRALEVASAIIAAKIRNSLAVLRRYEERGKAAADAERQTMANSLACLATAASRAEIDGHEGAAAKAYFDALMRYNTSAFTWPGRVKHPATDPLNALLSLAYTLLMNEIGALAEAAGLDPALGLLHELDPGRPGLALDLMEAFRAPLADRFVLTCVNRSVLQSKDFVERDEHGGIVLKPDALRCFFEHYEQWMQETLATEGTTLLNFRLCLRREVERFCRFLRKESGFQPFLFDVPSASSGEASSPTS